MDLQQLVIKARHVMLRLRELRALALAQRMQLVVSVAVALYHRRDALQRHPYRQRYAWLIVEAPAALSAAETAYPGITVLPPAAPAARPDKRRTVRVSITMDADQWRLVDRSIRKGYARSRADYFRRLHLDKRN